MPSNTNNKTKKIHKILEIIDLGENKQIAIVSPWKAITKKNFLNILKEKKDNISEDDILNTLVLPYISEIDNNNETTTPTGEINMYLSPAEIQFVLTKIRELSVGADLNFILECDFCKKEFEVETNLTNITNYTPNKFPAKNGIYEWVDLSTKDSLKFALKKFKQEPPKLIEMLLHLRSVDIIDAHNASHNKSKTEKIEITNLNQALDYYNDLTLPDEKKLTDSFRSVESYYVVCENYTCPHCGEGKIYTFDVVPGFFDPLLPADI